jgi:hypothetical protein
MFDSISRRSVGTGRAGGPPFPTLLFLESHSTVDAHPFAFCAKGWTARTSIHKPKRCESAVSTLANNARMGHPRSWCTQQNKKVGHPPLEQTSIAAGSLTTPSLHPNMATVCQREERCSWVPVISSCSNHSGRYPLPSQASSYYLVQHKADGGNHSRSLLSIPNRKGEGSTL